MIAHQISFSLFNDKSSRHILSKLLFFYFLYSKIIPLLIEIYKLKMQTLHNKASTRRAYNDQGFKNMDW